MNQFQAKIMQQDPEAIRQLLAENPDPAAAVKAALDAAQTAPPIVQRMQSSLAAIIGDQCLKMEDGILVPAGHIDNGAAERIMRATVEFYTCGDGVGNTSRWILGNILCIFRDLDIDPTDFINATELAYNTMATSETTFRFFGKTAYPMPFSHHKEIAYAKDISDADKHKLAAFISEMQLSLTTARAVIRLAQNKVRDGQQLGNIQDLYGQIDTPTRAGKRFLVLAGTTHRIVDQKPPQAEMEEADAVYEIRSIVKPPAIGGGDRPAEEPAGQA